MNTKYLLLSAILGGIVMFAWGAIYHAAIGIDQRTMTEFKDGTVAAFLREHTSGNGVYYAKEGVFAAINMTPEMTDRSQNMGPQLAIQIVIEVITAGLLAWLLTFTRVSTPLGAAGLFAAGAFTAAFCMNMSAWNWYGFSTDYTLGAIFGLIAAWFLGGLVIGWLRGKFSPVV